MMIMMMMMMTKLWVSKRVIYVTSLQATVVVDAIIMCIVYRGEWVVVYLTAYWHNVLQCLVADICCRLCCCELDKISRDVVSFDENCLLIISMHARMPIDCWSRKWSPSATNAVLLVKRSGYCCSVAFMSRLECSNALQYRKWQLIGMS